MSHTIHGGFLLQRYCPRGYSLVFAHYPTRGFYEGRTPTIYPHRSHIISTDFTSGMSCPRLSKSIDIVQFLTWRSSVLYPTHKWAGFTAQLISNFKREWRFVLFDRDTFNYATSRIKGDDLYQKPYLYLTSEEALQNLTEIEYIEIYNKAIHMMQDFIMQKK